MGAEVAAADETILAEHDGTEVEDLEQTELGAALESAIAVTGQLTEVFGSTDSLSTTFGRDFALGGDGDVFIVGLGPGGLARHGTGPGGGGSGPPRLTEIGGIEGPSGPGVGGSLGRRDAVTPRATVTVLRPTVDGFLERDAIERVVQRHTRGIRYCYERAIVGDATLEGRISATWTIDLDGRVASVSLGENELSSGVGRCVSQELRRMRFPRPDGGLVVVTYPFTFRVGAS